MERLGVGVVGCGDISSIYLQNLRQFDAVQVVACADLDAQRARAQCDRFAIQRACTPDELLALPEVDIVLNLTNPVAHFAISMQALDAGKHVYTEKPLGTDLAQARQLMQTADAKGLRLGCAPDTFLGAGIQTAGKLIRDGWIGRPTAATAFMLRPGHESWHPNPTYYYQKGAGPVFDMGPYYVSALVALLGPVRTASAVATRAFSERVITSAPRRGEIIAVDVPTHVASILSFRNGPVVTLVTSFDVWHTEAPHLEIYGTEGTLSLAGPNTFGGPVRVRRHDAADWTEMPLAYGFADNSRGLGLLEMVYAIADERVHRANAQFAYHVLDTLFAVERSSIDHATVDVISALAVPEPLKVTAAIDLRERLV